MTTDIQSALAKLVRRVHGATAHAVNIVRLTSGASLETWSFDVDCGAQRNEYILRRRAGSKGVSSIDLASEAALLKAVTASGVLAPPLIHVCDGEDGLGEGHVTRRIAGETLGRKIVADARFDSLRPKLASQCGRQLALIHSTASPINLELGGPNEVLSHYERIYRQSGAERPVLELAFAHLRKVAPVVSSFVLLHGDFRNGNLIVNEQGIAAVLDWELAHQGDPAEDLGWLCVNSWRFGVPKKPVGGFGDYADLLQGYLDAGGAEIGLNRLRYWQAVGSLKWAVMCLIMYDSWLSGESTSLERPVIGRRVSEAEIDLLNLFEAGL
jgi:aminoglycoside phosphotransferase (APT) family kinase protein